jgi:hypothetical protein
MDKTRAFLSSLGLMAVLSTPQVASAGTTLQAIGHPYNPAGPYLTLDGLQGQQNACTVGLSGSVGGSWVVEGLYNTTQAWTQALTVVSPDGLNPSTSITAPGSYTFNCANMVSIRLDGTSGTGTGTLNTLLVAGSGVSRVLLNTSGGGAITAVNGTSPIVTSTVTGVATVSCPTCTTTSRTQTSAVVTSASTPWSGTFTFGTPYVSSPVCIATCFSTTPIVTLAAIVSESTSAVTIYDGSHTGATYNVSCTPA